MGRGVTENGTDNNDVGSTVQESNFTGTIAERSSLHTMRIHHGSNTTDYFNLTTEGEPVISLGYQHDTYSRLRFYQVVPNTTTLQQSSVYFMIGSADDSEVYLKRQTVNDTHTLSAVRYSSSVSSRDSIPLSDERLFILFSENGVEKICFKSDPGTTVRKYLTENLTFSSERNVGCGFLRYNA